MTNDENKIICELTDVNFHYQDIPVLENVSLKIAQGDFLAILGPNGGGKTTLLKILLGLVTPDSGKVKVFGKDPIKFRSERHRIGYVPQINTIDLDFPVHVLEVVLMGRYGRLGFFNRPAPEDHEKALKAMERVDIADLADRSIARLSGGQRQRVFLARALVTDPELLLLDEPTTGIDALSSESLFELLNRLHKDGLTIIIVSHDIGAVSSYVSGIACLNRRVIVHGRPEEVMSSAELSEMYGCEALLLFHNTSIPHISLGKH